MSIYIDSDQQGLLLPVLTDSEIANLGAPADGMMAYASLSKTILLHADGSWNKLEATPIPGLAAGTTQGNASIVIGHSGVLDTSAILDLKETGFVKYYSLTNAELPTISYPIEGMLVYNTDENALQTFNGSHWVNLAAQPSGLPTSVATAQEVEGLAAGATKLPNTVLEDNIPGSGLLIPTLDATSIQAPAEGLFIYDTTRKAFLYFVCVLWNELK